MIENGPSLTALRVAMRRAAHQRLDQPNVFCDPVVSRILRAADIDVSSSPPSDPLWPEQSPGASRLRAFLAARSRYAEDELSLAIQRGVGQYVVLGAGLDTFAYRHGYSGNLLKVFEVDHPATQAWKQTLLNEAEILIPDSVVFSPIDLETDTFEDGLRQAGFDTGKCTFFSWLGVTPYITSDAVRATLRFVASMPAGSGIVFDYLVSPSLMNPIGLRAFDRLADRVAAAGEPFKTLFDPSILRADLKSMGFVHVEDLGPDEINARYFQSRQDGLMVGSFGHIVDARV